MKCPSCDCGDVKTTWIDHEFQYGAVDPVLLECRVPLRFCLKCGKEWLDHVGEGIMQEEVDIHLRPTVIDYAWEIAAKEAARKAEAYNIGQVVNLMESYKIPIEEMDEWCAQTREDHPCLFINHVIEDLG